MEAEKKMHLTVRGKESVFRAGDISPGDRRPTCSPIVSKNRCRIIILEFRFRVPRFFSTLRTFRLLIELCFFLFSLA